MSDVVYVVERGRYTKAELEAMPAIEVPKDVLESANYMNLYMEKVCVGTTVVPDDVSLKEKICHG